MDDITRGSLPEGSGASREGERGKGPAELLEHERETVLADAPDDDTDADIGAADVDAVDARELAALMARREERIDDADDAIDRSPHAAAGGDEDRAEEDGAEEDSDAEDGAAEDPDAELGDRDERIALDADGLPVVPELTDTGELARVLLVLLLSSREGVSMLRLAQASNTTQKLVEEGLAALQSNLAAAGLPVEVSRTGETVRLMTLPEVFPYLQRLRGVKKAERLSPAALETLAVIAYRQPVMRSEIEAIRGVKAGPMLRTLLDHKLVRITGRADVPGRPLQYGTTQQFLDRFGLSSLKDLPSIKEFKQLG